MSRFVKEWQEETRWRLKRRQEDWTLMPAHCSGCRLRDTDQDVLRCSEQKASVHRTCRSTLSGAEGWD